MLAHAFTTQKPDSQVMIPPLSPGERVLVLGGAKCGKSQFAESLFAPWEKRLYLATCDASRQTDAELQDRIQAHQQRRGHEWDLVEDPFDIVSPFMQAQQNRRAMLVDCLTLWLTNLMLADLSWEQAWDQVTQDLTVDRLTQSGIVFVSNEVGLGIVPEHPLGRRFRDAAGMLHQQVAHWCDRVYFVLAGQPILIKHRPVTSDL